MEYWERFKRFDAFMNAKSFAVHVLNKNQMALSFAQTGIDKFKGIGEAGLDGVPILSNSVSVFNVRPKIFMMVAIM